MMEVLREEREVIKKADILKKRKDIENILKNQKSNDCKIMEYARSIENLNRKIKKYDNYGDFFIGKVGLF